MLSLLILTWPKLTGYADPKWTGYSDKPELSERSRCIDRQAPSSCCSQANSKWVMPYSSLHRRAGKQASSHRFLGRYGLRSVLHSVGLRGLLLNRFRSGCEAVDVFVSRQAVVALRSLVVPGTGQIRSRRSVCGQGTYNGPVSEQSCRPKRTVTQGA